MANQKKNQVKRNERERKRVHQVNDGFDLLRTRLRPAAAANKKLSKADTLREAVKYIRHLQELLGQDIPMPTTPTSTQFYHQEKGEFDAYFPSPPQMAHVPQQAQQPPQQQLQYTSPTSSMPSYSPPQLYYSSPYHQQAQ